MIYFKRLSGDKRLIYKIFMANPSVFNYKFSFYVNSFYGFIINYYV